MTIKKILDDFFEEKHNDRAAIEHLVEILDEFFHEFHQHHPDRCDDFIKYLEDELYEVKAEDATEAVEKLIRKDGTVGERWSRAEINEFIKQFSLEDKYETFDPCTFYFSMNYAYAVHKNDNLTLKDYVDIAVDEMHDANITIKHKLREIIGK